MTTVMRALRIMSDYFEDDKELGQYIRMLTKIPVGSLDIGKLKIKLEKFREEVGLEHFADDFHEGKPLSDSLTLDDMLKNNGLKKST
mgnify:CR=1 FL=1